MHVILKYGVPPSQGFADIADVFIMRSHGRTGCYFNVGIRPYTGELCRHENKSLQILEGSRRKMNVSILLTKV